MRTLKRKNCSPVSLVNTKATLLNKLKYNNSSKELNILMKCGLYYCVKVDLFRTSMNVILCVKGGIEPTADFLILVTMAATAS